MLITVPRTGCCWCFASLAVLSVWTVWQPVSAAERTDWFRQAGWGVMTHYLGAADTHAEFGTPL
jgi:hypothetical protein